MEKPKRLRKPIDSLNGQIRNLHLVKSNIKVDNPSKETQVFIEVQVIAKSMNRTTSGLLFDEHCTNTFTSLGLENPDGRDAVLLVHKLFQIEFDDLFSKDVFANCDFSSLLSVNVSFSSSTTRKFWNSFKRCMSRFIYQRRAKYASRVKRSQLIFAATVEMVRVVAFDDEEDAMDELKCLRVSRRHQNKDINNNNHADAVYTNKSGSNFQSIFGNGTLKIGLYGKDIVSADSNYDGGGNDEDCLDGSGKQRAKKTKTRCSICLLKFEMGESVMGIVACRHLFHNKCIFPWFNTADTCPLCREPIW